VDAGRALALAALARDAQVERRLDLLGREAAGELSREREPQRVGAAAREVLLVAGRAERRTHRARVELAAVAVVVAHLDRGGEAVAVDALDLALHLPVR